MGADFVAIGRGAEVEEGGDDEGVGDEAEDEVEKLATAVGGAGAKEMEFVDEAFDGESGKDDGGQREADRFDQDKGEGGEHDAQRGEEGVAFDFPGGAGEEQEGEGGKGVVHEVEVGLDGEEVAAEEEGGQGDGEPADVFDEAGEEKQPPYQRGHSREEECQADLVRAGGGAEDGGRENHEQRRALRGDLGEVEVGVEKVGPIRNCAQGLGEAVGLADVVGLVEKGKGVVVEDGAGVVGEVD